MTRLLAFALALCCWLQLQPASAQDAKQLVGTWKLVSWKVQYVGEEAKEPFGGKAKGRLIVAPDGYWSALITRAERKPATNDAERARLLRTMVAYSGKFTIAGDKITTAIDLSWNEVSSGKNQERFFKMEGDKLVISSPEQASVLQPGKRVQTTLTWEREK
jgi:lipocalin-like protein